MSSAYLKVFNNHFEEFVEDVLLIFPENKDIRVAKNSINTLRKFNPKIVIAAWHTHIVEPYGHHIEQGNIDYFIEKDYDNDVNHLGKEGNQIKDAINKLRQPIREMGEDNKQKTLKYIQNLTQICKMYHA